jgi:F-type H+-transporting ATPase subunit epsilon
MTLRVRLVVPEGEIWSGPADRVVAKTLDGEVGVLTGHTPLLGILSEGSLVRILPEDGGGWVQAAVGSGFLSVADDRVSILARQAVLGPDVNVPAARAELQSHLGAMAQQADPALESGISYLRAALRAAGQEPG